MDILIRKISTYRFATLDLQLFLDTHPDDSSALNRMKEYRNEADNLTKEYESKYGPLTENMNTQNNWAWIKAPWPWENEEDK